MYIPLRKLRDILWIWRVLASAANEDDHRGLEYRVISTPSEYNWRNKSIVSSAGAVRSHTAIAAIYLLGGGIDCNGGHISDTRTMHNAYYVHPPSGCAPFLWRGYIIQVKYDYFKIISQAYYSSRIFSNVFVVVEIIICEIILELLRRLK